MSDPRLAGLLDRLADARAANERRATAILRGDTAPPARPARPTPPAPSESLTTPVASLGPTLPRSAPPNRRPGATLRRVSRPVAALVLTAAAVLGGWLLVLEPALGSRPVLVRDEAMSPSLRTGDVALAVAPDGQLGAGAIVAVRTPEGRRVTRIIGREDVPVEAAPEVRAAAGLVVRADGEPLEVSAVVALDAVVGEVGAAVPRVGLPLVLLTDPGRSPAGTVVVVVLLGLTAVGVVELARERRSGRE